MPEQETTTKTVQTPIGPVNEAIAERLQAAVENRTARPVQQSQPVDSPKEPGSTTDKEKTPEPESADKVPESTGEEKPDTAKPEPDKGEPKPEVTPPTSLAEWEELILAKTNAKDVPTAIKEVENSQAYVGQLQAELSKRDESMGKLIGKVEMLTAMVGSSQPPAKSTDDLDFDDDQDKPSEREVELRAKMDLLEQRLNQTEQVTQRTTVEQLNGTMRSRHSSWDALATRRVQMMKDAQSGIIYGPEIYHKALLLDVLEESGFFKNGTSPIPKPITTGVPSAATTTDTGDVDKPPRTVEAAVSVAIMNARKHVR